MKLLIDIPEKMYHMINANFYDYGDMNIIIQNGVIIDKKREQEFHKISKFKCPAAIFDKISADIEQEAFDDANGLRYISVNRVLNIIEYYKGANNNGK